MISIARFCLLMFIATSGYTLGISDGGNAVTSRVNPADVFALAGVLFAVLSPLAVKINNVARSFCWLVVLFVPGLFFSENTGFTISELIALATLASVIIASTSVFRFEDLNVVFLAIAVSAFVPSAIGIVDILTPALKSFDLGKGSGVMRSSTFRNGGQAGEFLLVALTLMIPYKLSGLIKSSPRFFRLFFDLSLVSSFVFFLLTIKVASYIGLFAGLCLLAITSGKVVVLVYVLFSFSACYVLWLLFSEDFPRLADWMRYRVSARLDNPEIISEGGFIYDNFASAFEAFRDNPLFGSGIGGIWKVYHKNEVHSTYIKIIGETGLVGSFAYAQVMRAVLDVVRVPGSSQRSPATVYLDLALPLMLGCAVSWIYTYHLRKREFAVLIVVACLVRSGVAVKRGVHSGFENGS